MLADWKEQLTADGWVYPDRPRSFLWAVLLLVGVAGLGFGVEQSEFSYIALFFGCAFLGYVGVLQSNDPQHLWFWLLLAVLLRVLLVAGFPALSDDIYRFVWDGRLQLAGHNPFDHPPNWYIEQGAAIPGIDQALYDRLNSQEYHSIYPPVAQLVFTFSCWLFPQSLLGSSIIMKLFLLLGEIGSIILLLGLLRRWQLPLERVLIYALNPLMIVEIVGNLHFEGAMVFFLLLALWFGARSNWWRSAVAMALSVASKLLPLMFFPYLIRPIGFWRSIPYFFLLFAVFGLCWWPLVNSEFLANFGSSFELYFRRFEFNASFFFLLRWIGYQIEGQNLIASIGPNLGKVVFIVIFLTALFDENKSWKKLPSRWLLAIMVYLLAATTVHPWYTSLPLVLCIFTHWRFPVLWTWLITFTYITYTQFPYQENYWIVGLEYGLVLLLFLWEWWRNSQLSPTAQQSNQPIVDSI